MLSLLLLQLKRLHKLDLSQLQFVGEALTLLRQEVGNNAAVLGACSSSGSSTAAVGQQRLRPIITVVHARARVRACLMPPSVSESHVRSTLCHTPPLPLHLPIPCSPPFLPLPHDAPLLLSFQILVQILIQNLVQSTRLCGQPLDARHVCCGGCKQQPLQDHQGNGLHRSCSVGQPA
jgi:hypothetical protein